MTSNIYTEADKNIRKTWLFMAGFLVFIIAVGYAFAYIEQNIGILVFAVLFAVFMNVFSYWYSDKIVLKMHRAAPATREANFDLWNMTENLAITAGLPMPKLYIVDDPAPNAFATGRNKDHAVICVTSGLLAVLNKQELEGVVAHEMSHIGNRDMVLSTVVVVLAGFIAILSQYFLRATMFGGVGRGNRDRNNDAGAIMMVVGILLAILAPIAATLIKLAVSRKREFLADADGALLTRYPQGLASALQKISAYAQPMRTASNADAHLFISNPFGSGASKGLSKLFMDHPPVEDRIRALVGTNSL